MKKAIVAAAVLLVAMLAGYFGYLLHEQRVRAAAFREQLNASEQLNETKNQMLAQLNETGDQTRTLAIPKPPTEQPLPAVKPAPKLDARAIGRKKREGLPMGVVLWDDVPVHASPDGRSKIYAMTTGDFVRVFADGNENYYHIQPGLDLYLAATTRETKPAGERLPDVDGWVKKSDLHVFDPPDAKEFIMEVSPMTLGNDTSFSTLAFYERAMKNPDPVVHRIMGPRLIALVLMHEDYSTSWSALYRDPDPKIRDAALSALNARGVGNSREIIEDLIVRLTELTKTRARGDREAEVLSVLNVLKNAHHPRVPAALASFQDAWKETQSDEVNAALNDILVTSAP